MNEMVNAGTTLFPLMALKEENGLYINCSILIFSIIATTNHLFPENLEGTTHLVKLLMSNILFALLNLNPIIGFSISLLDLTPLFFKNKLLVEIGEKLIQVPRQIIDAYLIYEIFYNDLLNGNYGRFAFIILSKVIYFMERRNRIKRKERNNFHILHCFEHLGIYVLLCTFLGVYPYNFAYLALMVLGLQLVCVLLIVSFQYYVLVNYSKRAPKWVKEDKRLLNLLSKNIAKNAIEQNWYNYFIKPWEYSMKLEFITWNKLETICSELSKSIENSSIDAVVGIGADGGFIAAYLAILLKKPYHIISYNENPYNQEFKNMIYFDGNLISNEKSNLKEVKGKSILLCDYFCKKGINLELSQTVCQERLGIANIKTLSLWAYNNKCPDYYSGIRRVPMFWEWGVFLDNKNIV